jgi:hypothetical protein
MMGEYYVGTFQRCRPGACAVESRTGLINGLSGARLSRALQGDENAGFSP